MPTADERLAALEARMDRTNDLFALLGDFRSDVNRQTVELRGEIASLRADMNRQTAERRSEVVSARSDMNRQFSDVRKELGAEIGGLRHDVNRRFEALDQKVDRDFRWLVGIQVTVMLTVIGLLVGAIYR